MDEPALTVAVQTDLPSPKPNRQKARKGPYGRLALRFAVLAAAASVLFAASWFTRPPELVWWTSPLLGDSGRRFRVLKPSDWEANMPVGKGQERKEYWEGFYRIVPTDRRPRILRWMLPAKREPGTLEIGVTHSHSSILWSSIGEPMWKIPVRKISKELKFPTARISADIYYARTDSPAFNRTYRQICNSLTIE